MEKQYYLKTIDECLTTFKTSKVGLKSDEAQKRLSKLGPNALPAQKKQNKFVRFLAQFKDIMILILLVASAISITVAIIEGTYSELVDGFIILAIVLLNAIIGFIQENKAEKAMDALKNMTQPEAKVIRDGEAVKVSSKELVVGDIVILEAGDIVPADVRLLESYMMKCDESSLTGESHPVKKDASFLPSATTPLADRKNMAFSGSVVVNGRGLAVVVATGIETELGKIAKMLETAEKQETPLQRSIKQVGKILTIIVLIVASVTFVLEIIARPGEILEAFLTAVAIAVAAIPESLPAVITIIMSLGVARLAKRKAIVKRLHAVETLGSCEVICSDKTGTLTQNVMTVKALYYNGKLDETARKNMASEEFMFLNKIMALCNTSKYSKGKYIGDPTETALTEYAHKCGLEKNKLDAEFPLKAEIPFDSVRKMHSVGITAPPGNFMLTKGAVDMILKICTKVLINGEVCDLTTDRRRDIISANKEMGSKALRVLACAYKPIASAVFKEDTLTESDLIFVGLVGMIDPPRREVKEAVKKCKGAGVRAVMITGDHADTAFAIAKEIGIAEDFSQVMTGAQLDELSEKRFLAALPNISVFARVSPENKVRIVEAFKKQGKIVAMTGDGVNDAPSIKSADIGVGMGITGTDVTKEVADVIITDDNFATIVIAVEEGRKIYSNIQKTIQFLISANLAEILSLFIATIIFPHQTFLLPVQILFINLITDTVPAIALGLEPAEKEIMLSPPRDSKKTIFADGVGRMIAVAGIVQAELVLIAYTLGIKFFSPEIATSMGFYTLNFIQFVFFTSIRVKHTAFKENIFKNKWAMLTLLFGLGSMLLIALTPLHTIIGLTSLSWQQWLIVLGLGLTIFPINEFFKAIIKPKNKFEKAKVVKK